MSNLIYIDPMSSPSQRKRGQKGDLNRAYIPFSPELPIVYGPSILAKSRGTSRAREKKSTALPRTVQARKNKDARKSKKNYGKKTKTELEKVAVKK